jgi:Predicted membrane protein
MIRREKGVEERPPVGIIALPQFVLPHMYGTYAEKGTCPLLEPIESNLIESPASCYTGLLATILLAPWALLARRRRSESLFFLLLAGFGVSWALNVPGAVQVLRLPGLNLMSHNRLVFATSFAILVLTAIGLENLLAGELSRRPRLWAQGAILAVLLGWCLYRTSVFPEPLASEFEAKIQAGDPDMWVGNVEAIREAQAWFSRRYLHAAALCAAGLAIWLMLHYWPSVGRRMFPTIGVLLVGDLLLFGYGKRISQDPSLYYPEVPALRDIKTAAPGRVLGIGCLQANLAPAIGLKDIRGYDAFDPQRWLKLLSTASTKEKSDFQYAAIQWFSPSWKLSPPDSIRFSPVLDMLSVRYAIFRGTPKPGIKPRFQSVDYWVLENRSALPRVFVPRRVDAIADDEETLRRLALPEFNAREVAYVETPLDLPAVIRGNAEIREEIPTRIAVDAQMDTPGLLVLADRWDKGWQAYVNGRRTPILQTNYAIRGVALPSGHSRVEFRYESKMLAIGNGLAIGAIAVMLGWIGVVVWRRRKATQVAVEFPA